MTELDYRISQDEINWLKKYIRNAAPSGNEVNGQRLWLQYVRPFIDEYFTDAYGNVAGIINPEAKFKVVIEAHADEIAWYVHRISANGFLHVERNGGSDPGIAPSQRVRIHTEKGVVGGIFGWPAIHTQHGATAPEPKAETIFIDCGCSNEKEVEELGIQVGDCVTYEAGLEILNKNFFVGRGLDNKIGGFMIATVARLLHQENAKLPFGLYIVNSVQEEVGLRGASLIAHKIKPHCAIITDVTHATNTPLVNKDKQGDIELGLGPVIKKSPAVHNKLREYAVETARQNDIPYQLAVASRKTGTDADAFAYAGSGIPSALIALPLRYMHTTVETMQKSDIENTVKLLRQMLLTLDPEFDFSYL